MSDGRNSFVQYKICGEHFQVYCAIPWCFMHQATIGLFGHHIVKAAIHKISTTLRNDKYMHITQPIHNQSSILSELKHALVRQESRILRAAESSSSDSESEIDCEVDDDDLLIDEVTSRPCELAMRMPLWDMTYDLDALHREPFCLGQGGRGQHRIILAACKQGASGHSGKPSFRYRFAEELPSLRFLGTQLAHFAYEFLGEQLGLDPLVPEEERDIARALSFLEPDNDKCDIFTFGGLAIRSSHHKGTVRVRARPFDSFHGKYPQVNAL